MCVWKCRAGADAYIYDNSKFGTESTSLYIHRWNICSHVLKKISALKLPPIHATFIKEHFSRNCEKKIWDSETWMTVSDVLPVGSQVHRGGSGDLNQTMCPSLPDTFLSLWRGAESRYVDLYLVPLEVCLCPSMCALGSKGYEPVYRQCLHLWL